MNDIAIPYLKHPLETVRRTALYSVEISDDKAMRAVLPALGDNSADIQELAKRKLQDAPYNDPLLLIESLTLPDRQIREGIFSLLESLQIKDVDVMRFVRAQFGRAYGNLAEADALSRFPESVERDLLIDHVPVVRTLTSPPRDIVVVHHYDPVGRGERGHCWTGRNDSGQGCA